MYFLTVAFPEPMNSEEILKNEPSTNRAESLLRSWEKRLASGEIDEVEWYRGIGAEITPAYLWGDNLTEMKITGSKHGASSQTQLIAAVRSWTSAVLMAI
jgi:hypothetical protein